MARVLVCVTKQTSCERLIRAGAQFAAEQGGELSVVHVAAAGTNFLESESEGEALEYLFGIAKEYGADMTVLRADDVLRALVRHARDKRATHIILGVTTHTIRGSSTRIAAEMERQLKGTQVIPIPA